MEPSASTRARISATALVILLVVLAEFVFMTAVYHLDDHVDVQRAAATRVQGTLDAWRPGEDPAPVEAAVRSLLATHAPDSAHLQGLTRQWAADPLDPRLLERVRAGSAATEHAVAAAQERVDREASTIHAVVLVLVSLGWFLYLRRLIRRHRQLQRELTEQQVLDAGERRLLALVQHSADLVVVLEPDSTTSFASPAAMSVLGIPAEEVLGLRFVDLLVPRDVPMFVRLLAGSREGDHTVVLRARHADGRELVLEGTLTNLMADEAVNGWVLTVHDVTDRQSMQEELTYQAFHDSLTGLANRQLFGDRLDHALRRRDGSVSPICVLFLDVDDFKHVNDSLGHATGDRLLVGVAARISSAMRQGDTAARLGGDEFAVLMEDADLEAGQEVAARMLRALSAPIVVDGHHHPVRASIGIAEALPGEATGDEVLRNADVAMYWAKDRGKGTVAVYEAGLHAEALERLALRSELQRAIRDGQLVLHYQPTVDLDTQAITGFEALVRWDHPVRGLLFPADFIPVAEQSGLVVPLGSWVLREACRAGAALQSAWQQPTISVNVAARQLARADFVDEVVDVLRLTRLPASRLVLEITESVLLDDMAGTVASLARLREHGVRVAIDDFGTGYSSLSYLSQLPVDVLKVDKSFVDHVGTGGTDASLVEAIIKMSHSMQLTTVAEGVEQPEQAAWLRGARCSLGQGYLWSRPVELAAARDLLVNGTHPSQVVRPLATGQVRGGGEGDGTLSSVS